MVAAHPWELTSRTVDPATWLRILANNVGVKERADDRTGAVDTEGTPTRWGHGLVESAEA